MSRSSCDGPASSESSASCATRRLLRAWRHTQLGLRDLGQGGRDLGLVGALPGQRELGLRHLVADRILLQLDGLGRCTGVGEMLDIVIGALGLTHVHGRLPHLRFLDGELLGGGAGQQVAVTGLRAGQGRFGAGDAGLGNGHVCLRGDDVGLRRRLFQLLQLRARLIRRETSACSRASDASVTSSWASSCPACTA